MCLVLALWLEGEGNLNSEVGKAGRHFAKSPQTAKRKFLSSLSFVRRVLLRTTGRRPAEEPTREKQPAEVVS